jgi:hypothetical protein
MTTIYKCCHGKTIRPGKAWTDENGVTHPASWHTYSAAQKAALGITEIVQQPHPDSRLYTWSYNADGTVNSTAKPLDDVNEVDENGDPLLDEKGQQVVTFGVKSVLIAEVKSQQGSLLAGTDWAIVRKADTGIDVPTNIQQWRNEIRLAASLMEDAISQAATTDAIAALFVRYTGNSDGSVSKTGMLYDWPELSA